MTYNVGGVVLFVGGGLLWYERYIRRLQRTDPEVATEELTPTAPARSAENAAILADMKDDALVS